MSRKESFDSFLVPTDAVSIRQASLQESEDEEDPLEAAQRRADEDSADRALRLQPLSSRRGKKRGSRTKSKRNSRGRIGGSTSGS